MITHTFSAAHTCPLTYRYFFLFPYSGDFGRKLGFTTGNRSYYLLDGFAKLEQALVRYTIDNLIAKVRDSFFCVSDECEGVFFT